MTDPDKALTTAIADAMEADHRSHLSPEEIRPFLETVKSGIGLLGLIRQLTDVDAHWIETATMLDPVEDRLDMHDVHYYLKLLHNAAQKLTVSRDELQALYLRNLDMLPPIEPHA